MDIKTVIQDYLDDTSIMQLATVKYDKPWLSTLQFAVDADWNLYWVSSKSRRHSLEIVDNSAVAVAIVRDPVVKQGLQLEGVASMVADGKIDLVHEIYCKRYGDKPELLLAVKADNAEGPAYYQVKLTSVKMHDEVNFPSNPQQVYKI